MPAISPMCEARLLIRLIRAMQRKGEAVCALDTHAGIGRYDVLSEQGGPANGGRHRRPAGRIHRRSWPNMWPGGTARPLSRLAGHRRVVAPPAGPAGGLRTAPRGRAILRRNMRGDPIAVHERDGYEALNAFLPPPERRGLILIDPPFEGPMNLRS